MLISTQAAPNSKIKGPNQSSQVVGLTGGRYSTKSPYLETKNSLISASDFPDLIKVRTSQLFSNNNQSLFNNRIFSQGDGLTGMCRNCCM